MQAPLRLAAAAGTLALLAGCGGAAAGSSGDDGRLRVVATTTQIADFTRQVGGDRVEVTTILRPGVEPHDYEPSPADLRAIGRAAVVLQNGVGLEEWLDETVASSGFAGPVVDTSAGIAIRDGDDPHVWQDPRNAKVMVTTVERALAEAAPESAEMFRANADRYRRDLDALDAEVAAQIATIPAEDREIVTNHDSLGYYFDRYGLRFLGSVVPSFDDSGDLSGEDLADLVSRLEQEQVKAIFSESDVPADTAEAVARDAGVEVVAGEDALYADTLGPEGSPGDTYVNSVRHNTRVIVEALT